MKRLASSALAAVAIVVAPFAFAQTPESAAHPAAQAAPNAPSPEAAGEGEHAGGEHESAEAEELHHETGAPPAFNFADFDRFAKEKEAQKEGHGTPVIPYVYLLINALILYGMYYYLGKKPISEGLQSRRDTIAKELDEATKIKEEAAAKLEEYTERLDKLDAELDRLKAELTLAGEKDRDRIVKEAEEKAARMKKDAQFLLDQEMKQLRIDLQKYAVEAAMRAAEQAIKTKISSQDHDRVADEYVANIGKLPPPGAKGTVTKAGAS
jgi:F-type H+-transporting ATPase subunit b